MHHGNCRRHRVGFQPPAKFESIDIREIRVEQNDLGALGCGDAENRRSIACILHTKPVVIEQTRDHRSAGGIVENVKDQGPPSGDRHVRQSLRPEVKKLVYIYFTIGWVGKSDSSKGLIRIF
jgi:hypothetical protein